MALFLSIKLIDMNIAKIEKIIELQKRCNSQIDVYGSADSETTDEMLLLVDSLTAEEETRLLEMYFQGK